MVEDIEVCTRVCETELLDAVVAANSNVVLVLLNAGCLAFNHTKIPGSVVVISGVVMSGSFVASLGIVVVFLFIVVAILGIVVVSSGNVVVNLDSVVTQW